MDIPSNSSRSEAGVRIGIGAVLVSCAVFATARLAVQLIHGLATPWWGNALGFVAMVVIGWIYNRNPQRTRTLAIHGTGAVATVALVVPVFYGMPSTLWWMALVPFAMVMLGTPREAAVWLAITAGSVAVGTFVDASWIVANAAGETSTEVFLARMMFVVVLLGIATAFRGEVDGREAELRGVAAELQRANDAKGRFLANMSHELRTPLHGVVAMTDLALRQPLSPEATRQIRTANSSANLLYRLLGDLLDVSRADAKALELVERPFRLSDVVADTLGPFEMRARSSDIRFGARTIGTVVDERRGDPTRFAQILLNLVGNAVKFTESGSIEVTVRQGSDPGRIELRIADTGRGIPLAERARVFDAFTQLEPGDTQAGVGLGLAIVAEVVRLMNGTVRIDADDTVGTTFLVDLELAPNGTTPCRANLLLPHAPPKMVSLAPTDTRLRVLVAEDDLTNQLVAQVFLKKLGHLVTLVANGQEALDALEAAEFDLLLTDLRMPVLDGVGVIRALQERPNSPPIVLCTAQAGPEELGIAETYDLLAVLGKPFTLDRLSAVLASVPTTSTSV